MSVCLCMREYILDGCVAERSESVTGSREPLRNQVTEGLTQRTRTAFVGPSRMRVPVRL